MKRTLCLSLAAAALALAACEPRGEQASARVAPSRSAPSSSVATAPPATQPEPPQTAAAPSPPASSIAQKNALGDTVITARTKAAILSDPGMTGSDVSVNTDRGVVSLTGTIKSQEQSAIASAYAQRQDGVLRVDNHLAANLQ